ncbi:MAG: hypothetical protein AAFV88_16390 [Planctomycetota bacterium]
MSSTLTGSLTESFEEKFVGLSAENLLQWAVDEFQDSLAVSTSFGIQSSVTLHLATRPLQQDDTDDRDTRFRGLKQECGLHLF